MKFLEVTLEAADLAPLREFYAGDLGLPLAGRAGGSDSLTLRAGATRLTFRRGAGRPFYHFAFNVHPARFERARATFAALVPLLHDRDGKEVFDFRSWDARACYFIDPAGNVVELIARDDLAGEPIPPEPGLLSVGELGLVSDNVPALIKRIKEELCAQVYRESAGDGFAALGDEEGLLILVQRGRIWYPETGKAAALAPVACRLETPDGTLWQLQGPPYHFKKAVDEGQGNKVR